MFGAMFGGLARNLRDNPGGLLAEQLQRNPGGVATGTGGRGGLGGLLARLRERPGENREIEPGQDPMDLIRQSIEDDAPRSNERWVDALSAVGATMQDIGANNNGRAGGNLDRFTQAQDRMRQAREDHRRRQLRFEHFRETIPASDTRFWQAYALGGEEAALSALQTRNATQDRRGDMAVTHGYNMAAQNDRQDFEAGQGAINRAHEGGMAAANRGHDALQSQLDRDARANEGRLDREHAAVPRSRDAILAEAARVEMQRGGGVISPEGEERIQNLTSALMANDGRGMSAETAMALMFMPEDQRREFMQIMGLETEVAAPSDGELPMISSQEDYDNLPSGARYRRTDGSIGTKP